MSSIFFGNTLANQNEIAAAREAYDALGELQPLVREAALKKLTDAEESLKKLQAGVDAVVDLIDKLPATEELKCQQEEIFDKMHRI